MPGERVDVLVDFNSAEALDDSGASVGPIDLSNARIIVENWAGDGPYGGEPILPPNDPAAIAFRSVDIPEVMFSMSALQPYRETSFLPPARPRRCAPSCPRFRTHRHCLLPAQRCGPSPWWR